MPRRLRGAGGRESPSRTPRPSPPEVPLDALLPVLGAAVVALLFWDVFLTVFHPSGRGGPINRRQNRLVWRLFRWLGGWARREESRAYVLSMGGPFLIVATLLVWLLTLILGFALVYYPAIGGFLVSPGTLRSHWAETLYFSGYTATTLGLGDLVPDTPSLRFAAVVEAFAGFALVTVAITYLLAVYRELIVMRTLAADIAVCFRSSDVERLLGSADAPPPLARWAERATHDLLAVLQGHHQYPVLHYFRSLDPSTSLPLQLGRLVELFPGAGAEAPGWLAHPSFGALHEATRRYLLEVEAHFVPGASAVEEESGEMAPAHQRLLRFMGYDATREG